MLKEYTATLTVDGSGDGTAYAGSRITGRVHAIKYVPGTIDTNGDLTISGETTGVPILTKANAGTSPVWYYPMAAANKVDDAAASSLTEVPVYVLKERIKIVVAQGGASTTGTITFYVDEET